jgi:hypothetical protein
MLARWSNHRNGHRRGWTAPIWGNAGRIRAGTGESPVPAPESPVPAAEFPVPSKRFDKHDDPEAAAIAWLDAHPS